MDAYNGSSGGPSVAPPPAGRGLGARVGRDLGPRVASGLVIAAVALGVILAGPWPFAMMMALVGGVVAWEWSGIVRGPAVDGAMCLHVLSAFVAALMTGFGFVATAIGFVAASAIVQAVLCQYRHPQISAAGVAFAGLPGIALLWLRHDATHGIMAVLFVITAVAFTDIGAYFSGRLIGGPKLWPRISPNKTWAGLGGGVTAAAVVGAASALFVAGANAWHLSVLGAALALVAQAGDLAESALKRHFGAKDASQLIPGHGGFMDRVDGLATASVLAALWAASLDTTAPARALLTW